MSGDISPLRPVSPSPMVREKRHYPNEEKDKNEKKQEQDAPSDDDAQLKNESASDVPQKAVNIDKNNVKVGHIDEYA